MKVGIKRPSPALIVAVAALVIALAGVAVANVHVHSKHRKAGKVHLQKHSVGSRQIKGKAVTGGKFAANAVNSSKVANGSIASDDINLSTLNGVPHAAHADVSSNADAIVIPGDHPRPATCNAGTILIRGYCFDSQPNPAVLGVKAAADACAAKGGSLPTPAVLYAARDVLPLGDGNGVHSQFTDSYVIDARPPKGGGSEGFFTDTIVVNKEGLETVTNEMPAPAKTVVAQYEYICTYPLIH
jgi:hypothetical protein